MEQHYPVHYQGGLSHQYWFVSVGKRNVIKSVKLTLIDEELKIYNLLLMDLMEKIARKHNFRVLLHEKPFAGVNGSGKHNNWSLSTDSGVNLLGPGKTPMSNLQFLPFFI